MMRIRASLAAALLLCGVAAQTARAQTAEKDLAPRFKDWLKLTAYIIQPPEKEVFLKLANDRERDIFIEAFWKQRDPTPATPENEYKDELLKRFQYANTQYHRGTSREGWMTDMGHVYIILGPPVSVEHFEGTSGIYPCQVWSYYGDPAKSLPTNFVMIFVQRRGGEFKLYSPVSDGPDSLIVDTEGLDVTDHQVVYEKLRDLAPTLATVALSLIPGQVPAGLAPSPQTAIMLANVFNVPKKDVNPAYATHFLHYKGVVSTEYLTNYVESTVSLAVIRDPILGMDFVHFAMTPRSVSIDYYQPRNEYYCNFKLNVSLRRKDAVVFQYSKDYPFYFPPGKVEAIQSNGIAVMDVFPIAEGTSGLTILLQNAVGKEFSIFEKEIVVPAGAGPVRMTQPVIGYKLEEAAAATSPFKFLDKHILTDTGQTIGHGEQVAYVLGLENVGRDLWQDGRVEISVEPSAAKGKPLKTAVARLADLPFAPAMVIAGVFPAADFSPDYYDMTFSLEDGQGQVVGTVQAPFVVSPAEAIPHPVTLVRALPDASGFLYYFGLAFQYDKAGEAGRAEALYAKGHALRPDYPEGIIDYANALLRSGKFEAALELAEGLKGKEKFDFDYFLIRGLGLLGKKDYAPALASLLEANGIYNSDTRVLNALGRCYYATGKAKEARDALAASLRLNPDQTEIRTLAEKIGKEIK
jgi:GWxTD domain-containing protein